MTEKNPATNNGSTPLHLAAGNGHLEIFELISKNVTVKNPKRNDGVTPQKLLAEYCQRCISKAKISIIGLVWRWFKNLWK